MKRTIVVGNRTFRIDVGMFVLLLIMFFTSCFALYNAFNLIKDGSAIGYLLRQIMWYIIGFGMIIFLTSLQNKVIYRYMKIAYRLLMYALLYLFASNIVSSIFGTTLPLAPSINGAISWFQFPLIGSFQPSEFIKIVLIVLVAQIINEHQNEYPNPTRMDDLRLLLKIARVVLPPLLLIFIQPDTGVCIIIAFNILVLLMCSGIRREYVITIIILVVAVVVGFLWIYTQHLDWLSQYVSAYRLQRIEAWLNPESYILSSSNQLYTALLSLGSAGLTGYGLQANIISIPEAHTDFIFAAIGQCFGLLGTTYILIICLIFDLYLCRIAVRTRNRMDRYIVIGVIAMLLYQQLQNMGMIVGILPITGITLPLISYGGSSILSYFIAFAIIMNITPNGTKKTIHLLNRRKR